MLKGGSGVARLAAGHLAMVFPFAHALMLARVSLLNGLRAVAVSGRVLVIVLISVRSVSMPAPARAQAPVTAAATSPVALVRDLYREFAWEVDPKAVAESHVSLQAPAMLARYFTPDLARRLRRDADCAARSHEICALNFAILWHSQDPEAADIQVDALRMPGEVAVQFRTPSDGRTVSLYYTLRQTPAGWRIDDIRYPSPVGATLRTLLARAL